MGIYLFGEIGQHVCKRTVMKRFAAGIFQPSHILGILQALHDLQILLDGQDDRNGLAAPCDHFGFLGERAQGVRLAELDRGVNLRSAALGGAFAGVFGDLHG
jgi:hypothetical protein